MIIREVTIDDYKDIRNLNKNALGYDFPLEKTKTQLEKILTDKGAKIFGAFVDDKLIGYVHIADYECSFNDSLKNIMGLAVDPSYRKQGIGRALLTKAETWARDTGAAGIRLVSSVGRIEAHKFYEAMGYTSKKEQKNFRKIFRS
ncbi:GNAT family N-acetyltransferase [Treponema denticola]|uniref:GNAT family N-acetyltransferase n=1 Tax=Treponema denticola TaxID=158 RepID=UPI003D6ED866